ncbi:membrane-associated tyrosine- and threonine-specific cdc2-inhibitory kinase wee-1.3-like [Diabrotica virgifera virgifera]|nr:membrane-associated tyrosine- and threonine-specific cdc2-inhibitory kinase wee-1.3-like [Diabrotica virgifera virgifera]
MEQIYKTIKSMGHGAFGVVYKAQHKFDNKLYAIKKIKNPLRTLTYDQKYDEMINYEKIGYHTNILKYYMAWEENDEVHLVLELSQMDLSDYMLHKNTRKLPESFLWDLLYDMCKAIQHLNSKSMVHHDIKETNIVLHGNCFKLVDFGNILELPPEEESETEGATAKRARPGSYSHKRDMYNLGGTLQKMMVFRECYNPQWMRETESADRPSPEDILNLQEMEEVERRWISGERQVYTTINIENIQGCWAETQEKENSSDTLNLPSCSNSGL